MEETCADHDFHWNLLLSNLEEGENMNNYMCDGARPNYTVILLSRSNSFREHCAKYSDFDHHEKRAEILYKV